MLDVVVEPQPSNGKGNTMCQDCEIDRLRREVVRLRKWLLYAMCFRMPITNYAETCDILWSATPLRCTLQDTFEREINQPCPK